MFQVFAALAELIRELIVDGTNEGLAAARARGQRLGQPPAPTAGQIRQARIMLTQPEESVSSIARLLGVSRSTIYKYVPELAEGRGQLLPHFCTVGCAPPCDTHTRTAAGRLTVRIAGFGLRIALCTTACRISPFRCGADGSSLTIGMPTRRRRALFCGKLK